jgi:pimeloyl-ACP methyl ester carboxylesterase
MRATEPDREGYVDRDGVKLHEVFGNGEPTVVLVPSNPIVHSRQWKAQVPFLARHYRVVTFDGRGNGTLSHAGALGTWENGSDSRPSSIPGGGHD